MKWKCRLLQVFISSVTGLIHHIEAHLAHHNMNRNQEVPSDSEIKSCSCGVLCNPFHEFTEFQLNTVSMSSTPLWRPNANWSGITNYPLLSILNWLMAHLDPIIVSCAHPFIPVQSQVSQMQDIWTVNTITQDMLSQLFTTGTWNTSLYLSKYTLALYMAT